MATSCVAKPMDYNENVVALAGTFILKLPSALV
jgi:hypothetical protein